MAIAVYPKTCASNVPGNQSIFYDEVGSITSVTISSGEVTAVTMATGTFSEFDADIDSVKMTMEGNGGSSFFQNNKVEARFSKLTKELVTAKQSLVDAVTCGAVVIVLDGNGQAWLMGWNATELGTRPLKKITANFDSGMKPSDEDTAAYLITIEGESGVDPLPFESTPNATIVAGTATWVTWN